MVKFILGIVIVCFTSFCGYVLARRYRERKEFFSQLYEFNERFLNEIAYYRRPLAEFARIYTYKGEFQQTLNGFFISMKEGRERACTVNEAIVLPDFLPRKKMCCSAIIFLCSDVETAIHKKPIFLPLNRHYPIIRKRVLRIASVTGISI